MVYPQEWKQLFDLKCINQGFLYSKHIVDDFLERCMNCPSLNRHCQNIKKNIFLLSKTISTSQKNRCHVIVNSLMQVQYNHWLRDHELDEAR